MPDIPSKRFEENRAFYMDFLGMKLAMDIDFILTFVSQSNPTAQVSIVRDAGASASAANVALTVGRGCRRNACACHRTRPEIVYPLTNERWGVRRFFVADPNGVVINVMCHLPKSK